MNRSESPIREFLTEYHTLESRLADRTLYENPAELRRVSERLTDLQPAMSAYT
ncbi:hypothetical protein [Nocardia huaxiensis]|uniref:Peptide chain release factor 1 n=1 Tax=Nocardia huaxiensis TaxID=2755382 RepID=A0A7D6Z8H8_9NOCA|nr:hypothetical protein [Nocardia huaxiensis]QLY27618.1 hypothetical protein H0264_19255 [Nocardia huaxiensis]UFS99001.1 hypothetical protein LPY97_14445 [Nocardia huaxiensis]